MFHAGRLAFQLGLLALVPQFARSQSPCDLNQDGTVNVADVQLATGMSLGRLLCTAAINGTGVCNVIVVQRVMNAALGGPCVTDTGPAPHTVVLKWTASTSSNVIGYHIYRGTASGGPYTKLNVSPIAGTSYTDSAVQGGQTYYYVATAVDDRNTESVFSNEAQAVIPSSG